MTARRKSKAGNPSAPVTKNLLDDARASLCLEVAELSLKAARLEQDIARLKDEATCINYELVVVRSDLRTSLTQLATHDERRFR